MTAVIDDRRELLLDALDQVRLGDGPAAAPIRYDLAPNLCWDGLEDLFADPGYAHRAPLEQGNLRIWVEAIADCQAQIAMTDDELRDRYLEQDGIRLSSTALDTARDMLAGTAREYARLILRLNDRVCPAGYRPIALVPCIASA